MVQDGSLKLNSGYDMPIIGLGTWQAPKGEVGAAVRTALENGYRHIDCAACYGNEAEIGAVFEEAFAAGTVKREELFVTSKLWNSEHAPKDVKPALEKTLKDLRLDYVDMYLIHWPQNFAKEAEGNCSFPRNEDGSMRYETETTSEQTWAAMEALVDAKLVRSRATKGCFTVTSQRGRSPRSQLTTRVGRTHMGETFARPQDGRRPSERCLRRMTT